MGSQLPSGRGVEDTVEKTDSESTERSPEWSLHRAVLGGEEHVVADLIDAGASVNAAFRSSSGGLATLLHIVCASGGGMPSCREVIAELLRGKANLNPRDSLGVTPLHLACLHKNEAAVEVLIEGKADIRPADDRGRDALVYAVLLKDTLLQEPVDETASGDLVARLAAHPHADLDAGGASTPLLAAIEQGNCRAASTLLSHGAKPRFLHLAVGSGADAIVEELLRARADVAEEEDMCHTVWNAAFKGDIVKRISTFSRQDTERISLTSVW